MASVVGHIWAQTVYWNSTSSTKSRIVELAGPRNITSYSTLSTYSFALPGASGKAEPPLLLFGETGIVWYFTLVDGKVHRFPAEGDFDPPLPYIQANNVTKLKYRLTSFSLGGGSCSIRAVHVINYFE
jgi:hypothetical protein